MSLSIQAQHILKKVLSSRSQKRSFEDLRTHFKMISGKRDAFIQSLVKAESFMKKMELIFTEMNLPVELTRLTLIESGFEVTALSEVGALGVWQFMPDMGKRYLMINPSKRIDERLSPLKATLAAAQVLKWNYDYFNNWLLTVIAYNHGLKNLTPFKKMALNQSNKSGKQAFDLSLLSLFDAQREKPLLGWASRNYYLQFLAVVYAEEYRELFFPFIKHLENYSSNNSYFNDQSRIRFVQLNAPQSLVKYSMNNGIPLVKLQNLNPDVQDLNQALPKGFWMILPSYVVDFHAVVHYAKNRIKGTAGA